MNHRLSKSHDCTEASISLRKNCENSFSHFLRMIMICFCHRSWLPGSVQRNQQVWLLLTIYLTLTVILCAPSPLTVSLFIFRAVYKVASIQPVVSTHSSVLTCSTPHLSTLVPPLTPSTPLPQLSSPMISLPLPMPGLPSQGSTAGGDDISFQMHSQHSQLHLHSQPQQHYQQHLHPQTSSQSSAQPNLHLSHSQPIAQSHSQSLSYAHFRSQSHTQPPSQSQANASQQNGILDWLRSFRLHKYYPVFKQLTMEEVSWPEVLSFQHLVFSLFSVNSLFVCSR